MSISQISAHQRNREPIAIIGIGCRFPGGADNAESFWKLLSGGVDAITEIPQDRWDIEEYYHPKPGMPGKTYSRWGGFVQGIDRFEPEFFGISPREASHMDPQQRLLLEVAWEALEDGGQVMERLAGTNTGVFVGISTYDYAQLQSGFRDVGAVDAHVATGGASSIAANRVSYCLNLRGPSIAVDTACSSSLVAAHLACQSIWNQECDQALAGGVNVIISPGPFIAFCAASMLSPDGRCKAFDAGANGFVRGEGAGLVVLKPLSRAMADGDPIYAVILSSAVNQDGRTAGIAVPSQEAQESLLRQVCEDANIPPEEMDYVEAHGTGTAVGDPIEATALGKVLSLDRPKGKHCVMGSVKTNIGHLEAAAGIAGLIKVALCLKHRKIPQNLHFVNPSPSIAFEELKLRVPTSLEPWPQDSRAAIAGVNSFGFGGTNAHIVLMEHRHKTEDLASVAQSNPTPPRLFPLSARTPAALKELVQSYQVFLDGDCHSGRSLADLCYTAGVRRDHFDHRLSLVAHDPGEVSERLKAFLAGETRANMFAGCRKHGSSPKIAFVFSGQGPQWWGMGRQLLEHEPVFRDVILECDQLLSQYADWSLLKELSADEASSRLQETAIAQPALFALQAALSALWMSWGVQPHAVVGHSVGEVAAAYVAGSLTLNDALRVIFHRGRCMDFAGAKGKMLAVGLTMAEAETAIRGYEDRVSIAVVNSPTSITLSGDPHVLEQITDTLSQKGVFCSFLRVHYAFHSMQMDPLKEELLISLAGLDAKPSVLAMISTVTGRLVEGRQLNEDYWWQNVRQMVRFTEAMDQLIQDGHDVFLELSPHPVLAGSISECLMHRSRNGTVLPSLRRQEEERAVMLGSLGALYALGTPLDWRKLWTGEARCCRLPGYAWERQSYWHEPEESKEDRLKGRKYPLLRKARATANPTWDVSVDPRLFPYLEDHKINGNTIVPAAAYVEMGFEGAGEILGEGVPILEHVQFQRALFLSDKGESPAVQLVFQPGQDSFSVYSKAGHSEDAWTLHAGGYMRVEQGLPPSPKVCIEDLKGRFVDRISSEECYRRFSELGIQFGPSFRRVEHIWRNDGEALGRVKPHEDQAESQKYRFHPALLDGCFQVLSGAIPMDQLTNDKPLYLPVQIGRVRLFAKPAGPVWSHARVTSVNANVLEGNIRVYNDSGALLMEIDGFRCQSVAELADGRSDIEKWFYEVRWERTSGSGERREDRKVEGLPALKEIARAVEGKIEPLVRELGWSGIFSKATASLNRLAGVYVTEAFHELGWDFKRGEQIHLAGIIDRLKIKSNYGRLVVRFLNMLETRGYLERAGGEAWVVTRPPMRQDPQKLWPALLSQFPSFFAELTLIARCGQNLPRILRGEMEAVEALFPAGSTSIADHLYQDSPWFRFHNISVQRVIDRALQHIHPEKTLRILEIGAGTGGITSYVLPKLPADRSEYVFSDVSPLFLQKAEQKFHDYPFMNCQLLDIQKNPLDQDFEPHSFDIILASDVLHATRNLREALGHVRALLASHGLLVLLEAVKSHDWLETVFGLTEGWWNFRDFDLRPDCPLLSTDRWKDVLSGTGFGEVEPISIFKGEDPEQVVLLARGPEIDEHTDAQANKIIANTNGEKGTWLIFADGGGLSGELARLLADSGDAIVSVRPGEGYSRDDRNNFQISPNSFEDMERLVTTVSQSYPAPWRGTLHLWSLDASSDGKPTLGSLRQMESLGCYAVLHYVQALAKLDPGEKPPRLVLVTRNAQPVGTDHQPLSVAQAPLIGLGRVIANEFSNFRPKIIDLGHETWAAEMQSLIEEIVTEDGEEEVALRKEARFVPRIERLAKKRIGATQDKVEGNCKTSFRLEIPKPGTIDRLVLRETKRRAPGPGEVEIEVLASSLNFRDVMKALGLYPVEAKEDLMLGDECAGRIVAMGEGVKRLQVGDAVVGIGLGSLGSYVTTAAELVMPKPMHLTFEEAATLPVAYLTAYYSLHHLAQIRPGERVLIHSAAGGVGLAAIEVARDAGAELFATAGTLEKRQFLKLLGVRHVMDSRSLLFGDQIREITGGRGVDVVLNSLAGKAIPTGLSCLAPFGRFLELGKRDIYQDSKLGLWAFRNSLSFLAVDLGRLMTEKPAFVRTLMVELSQHIEQKAFRPLPYRVFPVSRVKDAFRYMAQGKNVGKVVVSMRDEDPLLEPMERTGVSFSPDSTYLVTGGLGGFGLTVARWIVDNGGQHLVLLSRSGAASDEAKKAVDDLRNLGAEVVVAKADVADESQLAKVLDEVDRTLPPLKGVFHAAMVLDDGILLQLDQQRFRKVIAPKVDGVWNLHVQTLKNSLEYFVLFSSSSSLTGNQGQGNYVAANTFLDTFAYYRRAQGLPAVTVNWGHLTEVGYVARHPEVSELLTQWGVEGFSPKQAMEALARILRRQEIQVGVVRADWKKLSKFVSKARLNKRFSSLMGEYLTEQPGTEENGHVRELVLGADPDERPGIVEGYVREQVARVLRTSAAKLDADQPLNLMGMDSLMAVELKNRIEGDLDLSLPMGPLTQSPTLKTLSIIVLEQVGLSGPAFPESAAPKASHASSPAAGSALNALLPLRAEGTRPPLFCIHPAGGRVDIYRPLAERLDSDRPLYGLQSFAIGGSNGQVLSIEKMATSYAEIIRGRQSSGPYHLLGFSLGGFLAMAVARVLEHQGQEVAFVGLVDCDVRWADPSRSKHLLLRNFITETYTLVQRELGIVQPLGPERLMNEATKLSLEILSSAGEQRIAAIIRWLMEQKYVREDIARADMEGYLSTFEAHIDLIISFRPERICAPLYIWWAQESLLGTSEPDTNWDMFTTKIFVENTISGSHYALMYPPSVAILAEQLDQALRAIAAP